MPDTPRQRTTEELEAGLPLIRQAPRDEGPLRLIVRRPAVNARQVVEEGQLDRVVGLVGDSWPTRGCSRSADGRPHPDMQINIMGLRAVALIAGDESRWPLAGDQLIVDLDLSAENLPPGTLLELGAALLEVTAQPHTGCAKFVSRFGVDAMKFVNSPIGRQLNLRGVNARVVRSGRVRVGDAVRRIAAWPQEPSMDGRAGDDAPARPRS